MRSLGCCRPLWQRSGYCDAVLHDRECVASRPQGSEDFFTAAVQIFRPM